VAIHFDSLSPQLPTDTLQLPDLQKRVNERNASKQNYKADEAARVAAAKRQIHEDRELVRDRTERERIGREARVAVELEAEAAGVGAHAHEHGHDYEHGHGDDHDEDDYHGHDSDEEIADVHIHGLSNNWGQGRRLDEEVKDE
jgi:hypothetical protein